MSSRPLLCYLPCLLFFCATFAKTAHAQDSAGIAFGSSFAEALKTAKTTKKPVLLDAMTSWCAPCRQMEQEVFSDPDLATVVENRFEAVQLDMERGEGIDIAKRFSIRAYPTIIAVAPNGDEIDRLVGYHNLKKFTRWVSDLSTSAADDSYAAMASRFAKGHRDTAELRQLIAFGEEALLPATPEYVYAYLEAQDDFDSPRARQLVLRHVSADSKLLDVLVAKQAEYSAAEGSFVVGDALARAVDGGLFGEKPAKPRQARKLIRRAYPQQPDSTYYRYQMRRAREAGKAKRYGRYAIKWQTKYPTNDPGELAELIYVFDLQLPGYKAEQVNLWREREKALLAE